nr:hypothetical protein [Tanacetum cinerariifolium]
MTDNGIEKASCYKPQVLKETIENRIVVTSGIHLILGRPLFSVKIRKMAEITTGSGEIDLHLGRHRHQNGVCSHGGSNDLLPAKLEEALYNISLNNIGYKLRMIASKQEKMGKQAVYKALIKSATLIGASILQAVRFTSEAIIIGIRTSREWLHPMIRESKEFLAPKKRLRKSSAGLLKAETKAAWAGLVKGSIPAKWEEDRDVQVARTPVWSITIFHPPRLKGYRHNNMYRSIIQVLPLQRYLPLDLGWLLRGIRFIHTRIFKTVFTLISRRYYNMHNTGKIIGELHALLIEYEKGLPKKAATPQKANKKSLKAKGKGKANGKEKDKQVYIPKSKNPKPSAKENPTKDDTCHHCKEVGHWKKNCPVYLAELLKKKKQVPVLQWNAVYDAHNEVACLMLESMTPELHGQLKNSSPYEMLQELKSMFDKQAGVER